MLARARAIREETGRWFGPVRSRNSLCAGAPQAARMHARASRASEGRPVSPRALYSHVRLHYNVASDSSAFRWALTWTCKGATGRKAIIRRETILCTIGERIDRTVGR